MKIQVKRNISYIKTDAIDRDSLKNLLNYFNLDYVDIYNYDDYDTGYMQIHKNIFMDLCKHEGLENPPELLLNLNSQMKELLTSSDPTLQEILHAIYMKADKTDNYIYLNYEKA